MATVKVTVNSLGIDDQKMGSAEEHADYTLSVTIECEGKQYPARVQARLTPGATFEEHGIEIGRPIGYRGPLNYEKFRDGVESYIRKQIGSQGGAFRIKGSKDIQIRNSFIFGLPYSFEFEADAKRGAW